MLTSVFRRGEDADPPLHASPRRYLSVSPIQFKSKLLNVCLNMCETENTASHSYLSAHAEGKRSGMVNPNQPASQPSSHSGPVGRHVLMKKWGPIDFQFGLLISQSAAATGLVLWDRDLLIDTITLNMQTLKIRGCKQADGERMCRRFAFQQ